MLIPKLFIKQNYNVDELSDDHIEGMDYIVRVPLAVGFMFAGGLSLMLGLMYIKVGAVTWYEYMALYPNLITGLLFILVAIYFWIAYKFGNQGKDGANFKFGVLIFW